MDLPIIGGEEYEWNSSKKKNLAGLTWGDCCNVIDDMSDEEILKLGFDDREDVLDYINKEYTITE